MWSTWSCGEEWNQWRSSHSLMNSGTPLNSHTAPVKAERRVVKSGRWAMPFGVSAIFSMVRKKGRIFSWPESVLCASASWESCNSRWSGLRGTEFSCAKLSPEERLVYEWSDLPGCTNLVLHHQLWAACKHLVNDRRGIGRIRRTSLRPVGRVSLQTGRRNEPSRGCQGRCRAESRCWWRPPSWIRVWECRWRRVPPSTLRGMHVSWSLATPSHYSASAKSRMRSCSNDTYCWGHWFTLGIVLVVTGYTGGWTLTLCITCTWKGVYTIKDTSNKCMSIIIWGLRLLPWVYSL